MKKLIFSLMAFSAICFASCESKQQEQKGETRGNPICGTKAPVTNVESNNDSTTNVESENNVEE